MFSAHRAEKFRVFIHLKHRTSSSSSHCLYSASLRSHLRAITLMTRTDYRFVGLLPQQQPNPPQPNRFAPKLSTRVHSSISHLRSITPSFPGLFSTKRHVSYVLLSITLSLATLTCMAKQNPDSSNLRQDQPEFAVGLHYT